MLFLLVNNLNRTEEKSDHDSRQGIGLFQDRHSFSLVFHKKIPRSFLLSSGLGYQSLLECH